MSTVADIPVRDGKDGTEQLGLLRAYLKDTDSASYRFPDGVLIPLLVIKTSVILWRELTGIPLTAVPWSYDPMVLDTPINRLRVLTGDVTEASLQYTDHELLEALDVIPLRYVLSMLLAKKRGLSTYPSDPNNPLHILRAYLGDEGGVMYTDPQLVDMILLSGLDPFGVVASLMDKSTGAAALSNSSTIGSNLASLDGISFSSPSSEISQAKSERDSVAMQSLHSVYARGSAYGAYIDGVNLAEIDWEQKWYAL